MTQLTDTEKKAILDAVQKKIDALMDSVYDIVNGFKTDTGTTPVVTVPPVVETPVTSTARPFVTTVTAVGDKSITVAANSLIVKDQVIVQLGNGQSVNVTGVTASGSNYVLSIDQTVTAAAVVGKQATVKDRYASTPVVTPVVNPSTPTTPVVSTPVTPSVELVTANINGYTGGDWINGTWQASDIGGMSLAATADVAASYVVGAVVTFNDNSKRTIASIDVNGSNYNVWFGAGKLNSVLGNPNTVTAPKKAVAVVDVAPVVVPVEVATPATDAVKGNYKGQIFVNLGMGAGGDTVLPGSAGTTHAFAKESEVKRAVGYGFKRFRTGFLWERAIQPGGKSVLYTGTVNGAPSTIDELIRVAKTAYANGAQILVDMHNYGGYSSTGNSTGRKIIGSSGGPTATVWANDWKAIILALKADKEAWKGIYGFDTMNEWQSISFATVKDAAQKFLDICAPIMEDKIAMFEGINYSSTVDWVTNNPDYYTIVDPRGKGFIEFSGHLYLDQNCSGFYNGDVVSDSDAKKGITTSNIMTKRIEAFAKWGDDYGVKISIGENIVTGDLTKLLVGELDGLKTCRTRGIDVYIFGMSDNFGDNHHNIELDINKPMMAVAQAAMKL